MSAQHTPGPWKVVWNGHFHEIVSEEGQIGDACSSQFIKTSEVKDTELAEVNARLIAAAPELLEACELALSAFEKNTPIDWNILSNAIAKAKGEA